MSNQGDEEPPRLKNPRTGTRGVGRLQSDLDGMIQVAEGYGLPRDGSWQRVSPVQASEYSWIDGGTESSHPLLIEYSSDSITVRPEPRSYVARRENGAGGDVGDGDFAHWVNVESGELVIGTKEDPTAFLDEVRLLADEQYNEWAGIEAEEDDGDGYSPELDPAAAPMMAGAIGDRALIDGAGAVRTGGPVSPGGFLDFVRRRAKSLLGGFLSAVVAAVLGISLLGSADDTEPTDASTDQAADPATSSDDQTGGAAEEDDDKQAEPGSLSLSFAPGDPVVAGPVAIAAAAAGIETGTMAKPEPSGTVPALTLSNADFQLGSGVLSGSVTATGSSDAPFVVGAALVASGSVSSPVIASDNAAGIIGDDGELMVFEPVRTVTSGFDPDLRMYHTYRPYGSDFSWSSDGDRGEGTITVDFALDLGSLDLAAEWKDGGEVVADLIVFVDSPAGGDEDAAYLRSMASLGSLDLGTFADTPYATLSAGYVDVDASRLQSLIHAGLPVEIADCFVEQVTVEDEVAVSLDPVGQEALLLPCFVSAQMGASGLTDGLGAFVAPEDEPVVWRCITERMLSTLTGLADAGIFLFSPVADWPPEMVDRYAMVLEECVPLQPFYLNQFSRYSYTRDGCPILMTNTVLANFSWRKFIDMGILDPDPLVRQIGEKRFQDIVAGYYPQNDCLAAG